MELITQGQSVDVEQDFERLPAEMILLCHEIWTEHWPDTLSTRMKKVQISPEKIPQPN